MDRYMRIIIAIILFFMEEITMETVLSPYVRLDYCEDTTFPHICQGRKDESSRWKCRFVKDVLQIEEGE